MDRKTPLELFEARNAVRIARIAQADKYAAVHYGKADQQLKGAEDVYRSGRDKKVGGCGGTRKWWRRRKRRA